VNFVNKRVLKTSSNYIYCMFIGSYVFLAQSAENKTLNGEVASVSLSVSYPKMLISFD